MNPTLEELIEEARLFCAQIGCSLEMTWQEADGTWHLLATSYDTIYAEAKNWKDLREALQVLLRRLSS